MTTLVHMARFLIGIAAIALTPADTLPQRTGSEGSKDNTSRFVARVLGSTEAVWGEIFAGQNQVYRPPVLVLYVDSTQSACTGTVRVSMGPFYCSSDQKIYFDASFFKEATFAQAYVIARIVGRHVQNQLGILARALASQQATSDRTEKDRIQTRLELQADCLAGVWARHQNDKEIARSQRPFIEPGDIEIAMRMAAATFTSGTPEQRQRWFSNGFNSGAIAGCDTFSANEL